MRRELVWSIDTTPHFHCLYASKVIVWTLIIKAPKILTLLDNFTKSIIVWGNFIQTLHYNIPGIKLVLPVGWCWLYCGISVVQVLHWGSYQWAGVGCIVGPVYRLCIEGVIPVSWCWLYCGISVQVLLHNTTNTSPLAHQYDQTDSRITNTSPLVGLSTQSLALYTLWSAANNIHNTRSQDPLSMYLLTTSQHHQDGMHLLLIVMLL